MNRTMFSLLAFIPLSFVLGCATGPMPDEHAPRVYGGSISHPYAAPYQYGGNSIEGEEYETIIETVTETADDQSVLEVIEDATADLSDGLKPEVIEAELIELDPAE